MRRSSMLLPLVALLSGCGLSRSADPRSTEATTELAAGFSDANIAAIVVAANDADILYADLALAKSFDPDVRAFATMVKKDHESVNDAVRALMTRLNVSLVENESSLDLRDEAWTRRLAFRGLEGFSFDSAYGANEVSYHRSVLGMLERTLIPAAKHSNLRTLLTQVRPALAAHLDHALVLVEGQSKRRP